MYSTTDLVKIAKRENNNKRKYLVVNPLQGKHIPVSPTATLNLFSQLGSLLKEYDREHTLLIGFAETATAIGAQIAIDLGMSYVQTTRECLEGVDYLYFTEAHSHVTEQKLVTNGVREAIQRSKFNQIIFIEDEVTTGNTILSLIDAIEKEWSQKLKYSIASLLNGMDGGAFTKFEGRGIRLHYLAKTNHKRYEEIVESFRGDGVTHNKAEEVQKVESVNLQGGVNTRKLTNGSDYQAACEKLWESMKGMVLQNGRILVLGTEEFMYPALYIAKKIENTTEAAVKCHATTRSPIMVSTEENYPLHQRWDLASLYEKDRKTFIYDLEQYNQVFIVTDAKKPTTEGINSLVNALYSVGNRNITLIRWCEN